MIDYSKYPDGGRFYSGAERKKSILINGNAYLVKFQKNSEVGLTYSHVSEYLGSHIFQAIGIPVQETFLGTYQGKNVVVMKDFLKKMHIAEISRQMLFHAKKKTVSFLSCLIKLHFSLRVGGNMPIREP